jgi:hypothetical protein
MLRFLKGPCPQRLIFITEARCCSFNAVSSEAVAFPKGYATDACGVHLTLVMPRLHMASGLATLSCRIALKKRGNPSHVKGVGHARPNF